MMALPDLFLYEIGTPVLIGEDVRATVVAASISRHGVRYEVAWWDKTTRHSQWLNDHELRPFSETAQRRIGFLQCDGSTPTNCPVSA